MKKLVASILLLSFTLSACSHVIPKYQNESRSEFYNRINKLTKDKTVSLKMTSEQTIIDCKELQVNPDSINYRDVNSNSLRSIATNKIISVSFNEGERGAWEGLLYGSLIGGVSGLISILVLSNGHQSGNPFVILYSAVAGAIIGAIYGSNNDSKTIIEFGN